MHKIGIDIRATELGFKSHYGRGTGRYVSELVQPLSKMCGEGEFRDFELQFLSTETLALSPFQKKCLSAVPLGKCTLETQLFFPRTLSKLDLDFTHFFSHGDAASWGRAPQVVSVLDLIPLRFPELYKAHKPSWRYSLARFLGNQAIKSAKGIVAISEATARDLVSILDVPREKIAVTPLGVDRRFYLQQSDEASFAAEKTRRRLEFSFPEKRPILLYVGGIDARKNVPFLLDILAELVAGQPIESRPLLLLAGRYEQDENYPRLLKHIDELGISDDCRMLGFVADADLPSLFHAVDLFAFPSLYEGFGLPVLEAMACGTPVVAGNNSSIPEVAGETAALLQDNNKKIWVETIKFILSNKEKQADMRWRGVVRAKEFTWENTARLTLEAYRKFLGVESPSVVSDQVTAIDNKIQNVANS